MVEGQGPGRGEKTVAGEERRKSPCGKPDGPRGRFPELQSPPQLCCLSERPGSGLRDRLTDKGSWAHLGFQGWLSCLPAILSLSLNPQEEIGIRVSVTRMLSPPEFPPLKVIASPGSSSGVGLAPLLGQGKPLPSRWLPSSLPPRCPELGAMVAPLGNVFSPPLHPSYFSGARSSCKQP